MFKRITGIILLLGCLTIIVAEAHAADWYDSNWSYRKAITVQAGQVTSGPHTEFPMLVSLSSDSDLAAKAQPDFDDILFTSSDGTTKLDHEIESYNSGTGALIAWVEVSSIDNGTVIYIYYGNSSVGSQQNVTGTWSSNYTGVWHLKEDPSGVSPQMTDSSSNNNHGTSFGGMTSGDQVLGQVNGSLDFDGVDDYVDFENSSNLNDNITIEAWINARSFPPGADWRTILGEMWEWHIEVNDSEKVIFRRWGPYQAVESTTILLTDRWYHVVIALSSGPTNNLEIYIDGASDIIGNLDTPLKTSTTTSIKISGRIQNDIDWFDGYVDEVRISNVVRSSDWITTSYNNQNNPSAFHGSPGSEESTFTWNGSSSTDWGTAANWDVNAVPGTGHTVVIPDVANAPTLDSTRTIAALTVNGESLTLNGNSLTVTGNLTISGSGTIDASAGTPIITVGGDWDSSAGTLSPGTGNTVVLTGTSNTISTAPPGAGILGYLSINAGANITVASDVNSRRLITISGTLTVNNPYQLGSALASNQGINITGTGELNGSGSYYRMLGGTSISTLDGTIAIQTWNERMAWGIVGAPITSATYGVDTASGDRYVTNLTIWNYDSNQSSTGVLTCPTPPCADLVVKGTLTIEHQGSASYSITLDNSTNNVGITAGNLVIGTSGVTNKYGILITGNANVAVNGNVTIYASGSNANVIDASGMSAKNFTVSGNWTNNDTFTSGTGTVTFNGSSDQTITSGGSAFNNLTLNNPGSSFVINGALDVDGVLTITAGDLGLDTNDPDVYTSGDIMIDINGSVTKGTGTWTYDGTTNFMDNSSTGPQNFGTVVVD